MTKVILEVYCYKQLVGRDHDSVAEAIDDAATGAERADFIPRRLVANDVVLLDEDALMYEIDQHWDEIDRLGAEEASLRLRRRWQSFT